MSGDPDETVRDECGAGRERVVGKQLEQIGDPADRALPPLRRRERRAFVRGCHQHGATELEATRERSELPWRVPPGSAGRGRRANG